jgi:hypothetical protein
MNEKGKKVRSEKQLALIELLLIQLSLLWHYLRGKIIINLTKGLFPMTRILKLKKNVTFTSFGSGVMNTG